MGIIKTSGIILLESNSGDFDKMVTLLTPGYGKIGCSAKGAKRNRSALLAGTQFLSFGEYVIYKGVDRYSINSCEPIEVFYNIRTDLDKLNYASEIANIVRNVTNENDNCYKILQLLLNTLYTISETNMNLSFVLSIFKLRLACVLGYTPNIAGCKECKIQENLMYFSIRDNSFKCGTCAKQDKSVIQISEGTKDAIKYIVLAPPKKLYSFNISERCIRELELISKLYLEDKLSY